MRAKGSIDPILLMALLSGRDAELNFYFMNFINKPHRLTDVFSKKPAKGTKVHIFGFKS